MKDEFIVIPWPDVQELMGFEDFSDNAALVTGPLYDEFGDSAFFVRKQWLDSIS